MARTTFGWNEFYGPKQVRATEVLLYTDFFFQISVTDTEETLCAKVIHLQLTKTVLV